MPHTGEGPRVASWFTGAGLAAEKSWEVKVSSGNTDPTQRQKQVNSMEQERSSTCNHLDKEVGDFQQPEAGYDDTNGPSAFVFSLIPCL